jgi:hypothetical protein
LRKVLAQTFHLLWGVSGKRNTTSLPVSFL